MNTVISELLMHGSEADPQLWRRASLGPDATLEDTIRNLNDSGCQITLIVDTGDRLLGTVTDGDVRRGLLRGVGLDERVTSVLQREALVVPPGLGREVALQLMQANRIQQLPVVDRQGRVVGIHLWRDLMEPSTHSNLMVLMAGGMGSRLRPHTEACPKPLLPVAGKPMLEHIIERARDGGITRFVISVHYLGHMIEEHFGDGSRWGVQISYVREQNPLGTAGAIGFLDEPAAPFLVSNGDVLTDVRYSELLDFHASNGAVATMAVRQHEWRHPYGVVRTTGLDIIGFEEKPVSRTHVNAGLYVLDPSVLTVLRPGERCDMPALFDRLKQRGDRTIVYPLHESWFDIGQPEHFAEAENVLSIPGRNAE
jgi:dTDP-glucose pyrophosphorylase